MKLDITAIIKFSFDLVMPEVDAYGKLTQIVLF